MSKDNTPTTAKDETPAKRNAKEITTDVLRAIEQLQGNGELRLPDGYSAENALKSAQLFLADMVVSGKSVFEACTPASIANSLLKMVVQGLSVAKNQCYFIPYGNQLGYQRSYNGSVALAKRVAGVTKVVPVIIYEGDDFEFGIDLETGIRKVTKHETEFANIDNGKIKGAYAVVHYADGSKTTEIMTISEIEQSWQQGATKGNSPAHKNFRQEMAKKTVINRACKEPIATSDDAHLYFNEDKAPTVAEQVKHEIDTHANAETIGFEDVTEESAEKLEPKEETTGGIDFPETV